MSDYPEKIDNWSITGCYLGTVYQAVRYRNAFHGRDSVQWSGASLSLETEMRKVNRGRAKGSSWHIRELPAIVAVGR